MQLMDINKIKLKKKKDKMKNDKINQSSINERSLPLNIHGCDRQSWARSFKPTLGTETKNAGRQTQMGTLNKAYL